MHSSLLRQAVDRRQFLGEAVALLAGPGLLSLPLSADQDGEDAPNTHNMLVVGSRTAFLSHLPMFDRLDKAKSAFVSPHRFQVILEGTFSSKGEDRTGLYFKDRQEHPDTLVYTLNPDEFVLTRVFTPRDKPRLATFPGTVFRGHLEQGGRPIPELEKTTVTITRVVHGRLFDPAAAKPAALEYVLFGKGTELFLAHAIFAPPDFDQVLSVRFSGAAPSEKELNEEIRLVVPDRKNVAADRLREKQTLDAVLRIGAAAPRKIQIVTGPQFYFEEGELFVPPTFDPTAEEKKK